MQEPDLVQLPFNFTQLVSVYRNAMAGDAGAMTYLACESIMAETMASMAVNGQQFSLAEWDALRPMTEAYVAGALAAARQPI